MRLIFLPLLFLLAACDSVDSPPAPSPAAAPGGPELLASRCTGCHSLAHVERSAKSRPLWEATVARMVRKGARLSRAEQDLLLDHLARKYGE